MAAPVDVYNVRPGYWSELAEVDTADAVQAGASPHHSGAAIRQGRALKAALEAADLRAPHLKAALDAARAEAADLRAQMEANQRELARLRALEGL